MDTRLQNALELARWERDLADASYLALRKWAPRIEEAVLPSLTAAADGPPPDLGRLGDVQDAWQKLVNLHVMPVLERLMLGRIVNRWRSEGVTEKLPDVGRPVRMVTTGRKSADAKVAYRSAGTAAATEAFLTSAGEQLYRQPSQVATMLATAVRDGSAAGETGTVLQQRVRSTLRSTTRPAWQAIAENLTRTVATGAFNASTLFSALTQQQVEGVQLEKAWLATIDGRTRATHFAADGQRRPLETKFAVGRAHLDHPGDAAGPIEEVASCRCTMQIVDVGDALPGETDRQTERGPGDSTVKNREGSQADEVRRRAADGVIRAREDPDREGSVTAAAGGVGMEIPWTGVLAPLGKPTGDERMFASDMEWTFRDLPLPLMWQQQTSDMPHSQAFTVGSIRTVEVRGSELYATGVIFGESSVADEVISQLTEGVTRPSVDICEDEWELVDEDGNPVDEEDMFLPMMYEGEGDSPEGEAEPRKVLMQFTRATLMGATLVAKPAFAEARITLDGAEDDDALPPAADDTPLKDVVDAEDVAQLQDAESFAAKVKHDGDESTPDSTPKKTPAEEQDGGTEPDTDADESSGADSGKGKPKTPDPAPDASATGKDKAAPAADSKDDPTPAEKDDASGGDPADAKADKAKPAAGKKGGPKKGVNPFDKAELIRREKALLASAVQPDVFDVALFERVDGVDPADGTRYDPKTGRVFGYLATWNACHRGVKDSCVLAPRTTIDYADFHQHNVETNAGVLHVGALTIGCGHAKDGVPMFAALEHYDNAGTMWAKVRVGEDETGIWFSGVALPQADPDMVKLAIGTPLSGDWRQHGRGRGGALELCAALSVVTPGFARPRGSHDADGRPRSLVAAGVPQTRRRMASSKKRNAARVPTAAQFADALVRRQRNEERVNQRASDMFAREQQQAAVQRRLIDMRAGAL